MSLAVWLRAMRKCSAAVVGLDLVLGLSMVWRCSLKRSFKHPLNRNSTLYRSRLLLSFVFVKADQIYS